MGARDTSICVRAMKATDEVISAQCVIKQVPNENVSIAPAIVREWERPPYVIMQPAERARAHGISHRHFSHRAHKHQV
jgi:hypothetical protein